jgi:hypothetical protein
MNIHPELLAMVQPEDLAGDMALVAQECGLETAVRLWLGMKGTSVSVPKNALNKAIERFVRERYDGRNAPLLAVSCGISERQVYVIMEKAPIKNDQHRLV